MGSFGGVAWLLLLGACLLLVPGAARAQIESAPLARDWNLRVGLFIPQMHAARAASSDVGFSGMVERTVNRGQDYDINVGIGYNGWDSVYSVPVMVNGIWHHNFARYGFGAGYAFGKRISGRSMQGAVIGLLLGYEVSHGRNPVSVDLRYNFISGANNELDGYSLTVGTQF
jgi:hypothetical protein